MITVCFEKPVIISRDTQDWTKTDEEARTISPLYENLSLVHEVPGGLSGPFGWLMLGWNHIFIGLLRGGVPRGGGSLIFPNVP